MKVKKTFRIEEELISELEKLATERGVSQTDAIEEAIRGAVHVPYAMPYAMPYAPPAPENREKRGESSLEVEALVRQLDAKDRQIEALSAALVAAQETARAAQALHAADKPELRLEAAEHRKSRWARLRDAWRG